ncbi:uncharacterized protein YwgA [Methanohalophilus levihalophilus]|uniref:hypothetical protein n=1 Tax=Methanohalophilus levihalophilus TaxID=1431282 RepID=UPI001AE25C8B|nr:hypothetical protein [Methanohalophilus levihalophilus]MBP2030090.1 uncharacterized protein YwgA [Methanohalophilus levihalophilus]
MDQSSIKLKLFLDELNVPTTIATLDERKTVQKAVYIGQSAGVNLGYSYGWYLMGPYSPELTKAYYSLNDYLDSGDEDYRKFKLSESLTQKIHELKLILAVPSEKLKVDSWLELIASIVYLKKEEGLTQDLIKSRLNLEKPHLVEYFDDGVELSKQLKLI